MAMSYCRLIQLKLALKYFNRSCGTGPNLKSTTSLSQTGRLDNKKLMMEEKSDKLVTSATQYQLPKATERTDPKTGMELFKTDYNLAINVISTLNSIQFTPYGLKKFWSEYQEFKLLTSQAYIKERAEFLGPELATAHFVCFRGGKVRFHGQEEWIVKDKDDDIMEDLLPKFYVEHYKTEAVDCSKMQLIYEGLENMKNMESLKWLSLEGCPHIDDWCLDRISGEYQHTLEYLNIKDCPLVTEKGISSLSKMKKLKTLFIGGHANAKNLELVCLMLEDVLPGIDIRGIVYCDQSFLKLSEPETNQ